MSRIVWPAVAALFPLATGPVPQDGPVLAIALCGGGTITIPIERRDDDPAPCAAKGCHAGPCRKKIDLRQ